MLNGTALKITANSTSLTRYNATAMSYADGLAAKVSAPFGVIVGTIPPHGTWSAQISRDSVGLYRLRQSTSGMRKRNELYVVSQQE